MQLGSLSSGASAQLDASALASVETVATSQTGAATSSASLGFVEGAVLQSTTAADDAALRGTAEASLLARASNVGGASAPVHAEADFVPLGLGVVVGLETTGATTVGDEALIEGRGSLGAEAQARSVLGEASATAASSNANVRGFSDVGSPDPILIAGQARLNGIASASLQASASSVGTQTQPSEVTALAGGVLDFSAAPINTIAIELGGQSLNVGQTASLQADSDLSQTATAQGVFSDTSAAALSDNTIALKSNIPIVIGGSGTLSATTRQNASSQAITTEGASTAAVTSALLAAVHADPSLSPAASISLGGDLQIGAISQGGGRAQATSIDAGSAAIEAIVEQDQVYGLNLSGASISAGADAAVQISAGSSQQARADHVGTALSTGSVAATAASSDQIGALQTTDLNVGGDLGAFQVSASLAAEAISRNGLSAGTSTARAAADPSGFGTAVVGLFDSDLNIGGSASGSTGLQSLASANLLSDAVGVMGPAVALAGNSGAQLIGIGSSDLSVGGRAVLRSQADGQVQAGAASVREDATAAGQQSAFGWQQGTISAGETGQVRLLAGLSHSVLARSVLGDSVSSVQTTAVAADDAAFGFGSSADLHFDSRSLAQGTAQSVAGSV